MGNILRMKPPQLPLAVSAHLQRLGARLATARVRKGWSQLELAQRIGASRRTLVNLEAGQPGVALGTALQAAQLLDVSLDDHRPEFSAPRSRVSRRVLGPDLDF